MNIIKHLDISIELEGSALSLGLLDSQNREVVLKSLVDELQQKMFAPVFRKLSSQPGQHLTVDLLDLFFFSLLIILALPGHFLLDGSRFIFEFKLKYLSLSLCVFVNKAH